MMTAEEALKLSIDSNLEIKSIINTIELLAKEGKTETGWIKTDVHCARILKHLGYELYISEGHGSIDITVSW